MIDQPNVAGEAPGSVGRPVAPTSDRRRRPAVYGRRGPAVRLLLLLGALAWWVVAGARTRGWIVLCYHGVFDHEREAFERQMCRIAPSAAPLSSVGAGAPVRPPRVVVTFDDAFANLERNAAPALRRLGIPATIFAVTGNLGATPNWAIAPEHPEADQPAMTRAGLEALRGERLFTIGSHTHTHASLPSLPEDAVREELARSALELAGMTGRRPVDLAYPHGARDEACDRIALEAGYARLLTLEPRAQVDAGPLVGRFLVSPQMWRIEFWLTARGGYGFLHRARRVRGLCAGLMRWRGAPS